MEGLPKDVQEEMKIIWEDFDKEKTGSINVADLKPIMRKLG